MASNLPSVAIIIPAYKCAQYIEGALHSCLNQTSLPAEIVVVNDGSPDNLLEVLQPFVDSGAIRLVNQENQGISRARNNGIAASTAELITFLDADDELLPHAVEARQQAAKEFPEADVVFGDYWMSDLPGERRSIHKFLNATEVLSSYVERTGTGASELSREFSKAYSGQQLSSALIHTNCVAIRRSLLEKIGLFRLDLAASQDYELWRRSIAASKAVVTRCAPLSIYYRWRGSIGKYEEECQFMVKGLQEKLASATPFSGRWRQLRKKIAKEYLSLLWAHAALRSSRWATAGTLLKSMMAYPVPLPQAKYAVRLALPSGLVRYAYRHRTRR